MPEFSEEAVIRIDNAGRARRQCATAVSWLRGSVSGEPVVSVVWCAIHGQYALYDMHFVVKLFSGHVEGGA